MKHNTFEPCKDHENGHFGWCLLCEIEQLRKLCSVLQGRLDYIASGEKFSLDAIKRIESGYGPEWEKQEEEFSQNW